MAHLRLMPDDPQLSLLPQATAAEVENHLAQAARLVERLAPDLSRADCLLLLGELALLRLCLERIELGVRHRIQEAAKRHGLIAS